MSAFFPINPGGGAGGGQPQQGNAFVNATINGNDLVLVRGDGSSVRVDLSKIIPDITDDLIKNITLNGNNLTLEYASGTTHDVDLKPILNAANVDYDNTTSGLQSTTTQDAIDEINNKLNDAYVSSNYTETTGEFDLIKVDGTKDTYRLAGLDRYNLFLGHNTFNEAFLLGKTPFVETSSAEETVGGHRAGVYCGYRRISTHHDNPPQGTSKYVSAIKIKVIRSFSVGEKVDGVYITEVRKTGDKATDVVEKTIVVDGSFIVEEDNDYGKCIYVPIQKSYTEDTYFLIGKTGSNALSECRYIYDAEKNDCVNNININALPAEGDVLGNVIGNGWIVIHSLVTDDINIREELSKIDGKLDDAYVSSNYTETTGEFDLIKVDGTKDTYRLAGLDAENEFTKVNVMPDLMINSITKTNKHYSTTHNITSGRWFGIKSETTEDFYNGFAEHIRVYVENIQPGTTELSGFKVWSVDSETDQYIEEIPVVQPVKIQGVGQEQYIDIPIKREFDKKVYFVFYLPPAITNNQYNRYRSLTGVTQHQADFVNTNVQPQVGQTPPQSTQGWCIYAELHGRISVKDKLMSSYTISDYNNQTGELTLTRHDGTTTTHTLSVGGNYVQSFDYDVDTRTVTVVDENGQTHTIPHIITEWDDLEFVSKTKGDIRNIFNKNTQMKKDRYYTPVSGGNYEIHSNPNWDLAYIPVIPGQEITLIKNTHDSQNYGVYNEQKRHQQHIVASGQLVNGMRVYRMTISSTLPQGDTYYLLINMHKGGNNPVNPNKVMVFDGNIANDDLPKEYIPYATHGSIFIDGSEVVHTFNPQGSTLVSQNTQDAIIELDRKITINSESAVKTVNNQRPDAQGNVQVEIGHITGLQNALDGKVNITQLSPISQPNKVPQLDQNGKLDTAMIPDLSMNQVHSVANKQEALDLINAGTADVGHVFILRDDNNSVHMYVNQAGTGFDDKCVQLTMSNGSIVSVNQITGDATGNVTLNANQIRLEAKPTVTVEEELGKKVSTINSVAPNAQGNIDLALGVVADNLQLKVNNTEKSTLSLYTDAEADDLIAYFI